MTGNSNNLTAASIMNEEEEEASSTQWSGLETSGMKEAKCSLLIQEDGVFDPRIKALPRQRVLVYQDRGYNPARILTNGNNSNNNNNNNNNSEENYYVDFNGCTILQLEPAPGSSQRTMPITLTVGGRCLFTPENYKDFRVMMRTREQSHDMNISPNGNFDWPDVHALLLCPLCGSMADIPKETNSSNANDNTSDHHRHYEEEQQYWLLFYPLLQITVMRGSQMTLGTRTICRLTCLDCMEDLLEGMVLKVRPASLEGRQPRLSFTLPATEVLNEAGSASFLEDGPPRPESQPNIETILDAWTLYNLWEHSGAWEALQNDYRIVLSRSMQADAAAAAAAAAAEAESNAASSTGDGIINNVAGITGGVGVANADGTVGQSSDNAPPNLRDRLGKPCGNPNCEKVHGRTDETTGEITRLTIRCKECYNEYYCDRACRLAAKDHHKATCLDAQEQRQERRERRTRQVICDTCRRRSSYTRMKKCSRCRRATYCSKECQERDWPKHKKECRKRSS